MGCCAYYYDRPGELPVEDEFAFHGSYTSYVKALQECGFWNAADMLCIHSSCEIDEENDGEAYPAIVKALASLIGDEYERTTIAALETLLTATIAWRRNGKKGHVSVV